MTLIKPRTNRIRTVRRTSRLQGPNRGLLGLHGRLVGDTPVRVNQRIDVAIGRDREFVAWRDEDPPRL